MVPTVSQSQHVAPNHYLNQFWLIVSSFDPQKWTDCCKILINVQRFVLKKIHFKIASILFLPQCINLLWPSDAMWWHRTGSTLARVMACCLVAPSHYLNQCWLTISKVPCHSSEGIIIRRSEDTITAFSWKQITEFLFKVTVVNHFPLLISNSVLVEVKAF